MLKEDTYMQEETLDCAATVNSELPVEYKFNYSRPLNQEEIAEIDDTAKLYGIVCKYGYNTKNGIAVIEWSKPTSDGVVDAMLKAIRIVTHR